MIRPLTTAIHLPRWAACAAFVALAMLGAPSGALAQLPKIPGLQASKNTPDAAEQKPKSPAEVRQQLNDGLKEARKRLQRMDAEAADSIPAGITPTEVSKRRSDLIHTVFNLERTIKILESAGVAETGALEAERRVADWKGFDQKPPYSFLFYDQIRNQQDAARAQLKSYQASLGIIERQIATTADQYRDIQKANEVDADKAVRAKGTADEAAALWRFDASNLEVQAAATTLSYYQRGIEAQQLKIRTAEANLKLIDRQLAAIGNQVSFTDADLATAATEARTKAAAAEKGLVVLSKKRSAVLNERDRARAEVEKLRQAAESDPASGQAAKDDPALKLAEAKLAAINAEEDELSYSIDLLSASARFSTSVPEALKFRRELVTSGSSAERQRARDQLGAMQATLNGWRAYSENERTAVAATIREQEARIASLPADSPERPYAERVLNALHRKSEGIASFDELVNDSGRSIDRWVGDDGARQAQRTLGERVSDGFSTFWTGVQKVWNFGIYTYEDGKGPDGKPLLRNLSLGWFLRGTIFFFVSYFVLAWFVRRIQRTAIEHGWMGEAQAQTLRRWGMVAVGTLLAVFTLNLLKIPITAFAFLGGALALSFGFGTQTIFKNLISGIIVLAERKVKVGDIIDVDGVIGKVSAVDTRSSTLRGFDGVETLIPNSMLLENRVTNWTYSNNRLRRTVKVGVAYGSNLQRVSEILNDCAKRHGLILSDPGPLVLFEDFGADSLLFGIYFWVELKESSNSNQIASDLRFMIDKRFAEAGISIAFPQRDLHIDTQRPLEIRLAPPPSDSGEPAEKTPG